MLWGRKAIVHMVVYATQMVCTTAIACAIIAKGHPYTPVVGVWLLVAFGASAMLNGRIWTDRRDRREGEQ